MRSKLKCPKCGYEFDYKWIPLVSFTSVRWGKKRYARCPDAINDLGSMCGRQELVAEVNNGSVYLVKNGW